MKNYLMSYGGVILFYLAIILCIFIINGRFAYLTNHNMSSSSYSYNN